ncbi:MAG TPA: hypothetical protein EYH34_02885 [Planctomycetes bacterium]|nr:hypothetical protein [Planctomycetota bacterium]
MRTGFVIRIIFCLSTALFLASTTTADDAPTYSLTSSRRAGSIDRLEIAVEVAGTLQIDQPDRNESAPMRVAANLIYEERTLDVPAHQGIPFRSVRYYEKAAARVQAGEVSFVPVLRAERGVVVVHVQDGKPTVFSPQGPLTRDELELVDPLGNSLLLDQLLPEGPVRVGQKWKHSPETLAAILGLEQITSAAVTSELTEVKEGVARLEMQGRLTGRDKGATATVTLRAKYWFDLELRRITWFGLLLQENRGAGLVEKPFQAVARLQMKITPLHEPKHLSDSLLEGLTLEPDTPLLLLEHRSTAGGWQLVNDRRWFVISDERDRAVLVLVEDQKRLAQCHVASARGGQPPERVSLADFQRDVQKALGKHFGGFVEASQAVNQRGYRLYRLVVQGVVDGVPIHWIYYLVASKEGQQVVVAFIVEAEHLGAFGHSDRELIEAIQLEGADKPGTHSSAAP